MRYLIQFAIPALILVSVVYLATMRRRQADPDEDNSGAGTFLVIMFIGTLAAVALGYIFVNYLG